MKENKHGFEPKQEFTMGGIAWTVIQTGADWVKCITSDCVEERAFDEGNKNDFAASSLRAYLNGEFLRRLIKAGAPEEMFEYFNIDLTADDGLKNYGGDRVRIGLITCEEYRLLQVLFTVFQLPAPQILDRVRCAKGFDTLKPACCGFQRVDTLNPARVVMRRVVHPLRHD